PLQIVQRSKRNELTGGVRRSGRHWSAGENEPWSNRSRKNWTDRGTQTAVVWRSQWIAAGQSGGAATRRKECISASAADSCRISAPHEGIDKRCLGGRDVVECARNRIQSRNHGDSCRSIQALRNVARKEARLVASSLFESEEEERTFWI